jgi:hypothetical protein
LCAVPLDFLREGVESALFGLQKCIQNTGACIKISRIW